jgi:hypothetical protein
MLRTKRKIPWQELTFQKEIYDLLSDVLFDVPWVWRWSFSSKPTILWWKESVHDMNDQTHKSQGLGTRANILRWTWAFASADKPFKINWLLQNENQHFMIISIFQTWIWIFSVKYFPNNASREQRCQNPAPTSRSCLPFAIQDDGGSDYDLPSLVLWLHQPCISLWEALSFREHNLFKAERLFGSCERLIRISLFHLDWQEFEWRRFLSPSLAGSHSAEWRTPSECGP